MSNPEPVRGAAAEVWRKTLSRISTQFGRLVFVSSRRDALTGCYAHPPLAQIVGEEITDRTLSRSHREMFSEWLSLTLARQKADLDEYLATSGCGLDSLPYREIVPDGANQVERQLYLTDLETLLALRRLQSGGRLP